MFWPVVAVMVFLIGQFVLFRSSLLKPNLTELEQKMSQAFNDAFAAYVAAVQADKQKAVDAAVAAATASVQEQVAAAKTAGAEEESAANVAVVQAAMPHAAEPDQ